MVRKSESISRSCFIFILFILFIFIYRLDVFVGIFLVNLNDRAYNLQSMMLKTIHCAHSVCRPISRCARVNMHVIVNGEMRTQDSESYSIETTIAEKLRPGKCVCVVIFFFLFEAFLLPVSP